MNSLIGNNLPDVTMIQMSAENGPTPTSIANICENKNDIEQYFWWGECFEKNKNSTNTWCKIIDNIHI